MSGKRPTTEENLTQAGERALSGENIVTEPAEMPKEYAAFKALLRQVVKPEPKPVSAAPAVSGKD